VRSRTAGHVARCVGEEPEPQQGGLSWPARSAYRALEAMPAVLPGGLETHECELTAAQIAA
jgi:hypothetical protein